MMPPDMLTSLFLAANCGIIEGNINGSQGGDAGDGTSLSCLVYIMVQMDPLQVNSDGFSESTTLINV